MHDLSAFGSCTLDQDGCTTCGDRGIPVRVVTLIDETTAICQDQKGQEAEIAIDFTPGVHIGDILLVHMGIAIAHISEETL